MKLTRNMNGIDQGARILLGLAFIWFGFFDRSLIDDAFYGALLGIFGIINIASASIGMCPVYLLAGISTHKRTDK